METVKTAEEIIVILHSINGLSMDESHELDVLFDDEPIPCVSREFIPGSFTRELVELIEKHMTPLLPECPHCGAPEGMACKGPDGNWRKSHKVREAL
jgi:hypothetical protein